jgi:Protein of unknown function (DUF444)
MFIVDRRLNPGSKSLENRQRFLRRAKALGQGAVKKTSEGRDIKGYPGGWRGLNPAGTESTNRITLSCRILQGASLLKSRAEGLQRAGYRPTSTHEAFELRTVTGLARLWRDQGKRTEARDLLAPICGWFTERFRHAFAARCQGAA